MMENVLAQQFHFPSCVGIFFVASFTLFSFGNMKFIHILLIAAIVLGACKKKGSSIDQNKIFQSYEMSYDAGTNITTFYARFYENSENGKGLLIHEYGGITVNGEKMNRNGAVYVFTMAGEITVGSFIFTDANGKKYFNSLANEQSINNDDESSIDNNSNTDWVFSGNPLNTSETISVLIDSYEENGGNSVSYTTDIGANHVQVTATDMTNLQPGSARIYTKRSSTMSSGNWTNAGGKKKSEYVSAISDILVY